MRHGQATIYESRDFMNSSISQLMERTETKAETLNEKEERKTSGGDTRFGTVAPLMPSAYSDDLTSVNSSMSGLPRRLDARVDKRRSDIPLDMIASIQGRDVNELNEEDDGATITTFASQLTEMRQSLIDNRKFVSQLHSETNDYCNRMIELTRQNTKLMAFK